MPPAASYLLCFPHLVQLLYNVFVITLILYASCCTLRIVFPSLLQLLSADGKKKTFHYTLNVPTAAPCIAFVIGWDLYIPHACGLRRCHTTGLLVAGVSRCVLIQSCRKWPTSVCLVSSLSSRTPSSLSTRYIHVYITHFHTAYCNMYEMCTWVYVYTVSMAWLASFFLYSRPGTLFPEYCVLLLSNENGILMTSDKAASRTHFCGWIQMKSKPHCFESFPLWCCLETRGRHYNLLTRPAISMKCVHEFMYSYT